MDTVGAGEIVGGIEGSMEDIGVSGHITVSSCHEGTVRLT